MSLIRNSLSPKRERDGNMAATQNVLVCRAFNFTILVDGVFAKGKGISM